ncbi:MAG: zinc ribbon domain-containing protein [Candidatus Bathyarchaeia archaeon]
MHCMKGYHPLLLFLIVLSVSTVFLNSLADNGYTTTVTQRFTTVLTTTKTETTDTTITAYVTRTETVETYIETHKVVMKPTTVLIPTFVVVQYVTSGCAAPGGSTICWAAIEKRTLVQYIQVWVNTPTTITSLITSSNTITETIEATQVGKMVRTLTEFITFTLENVYTSIYSPPTTQTGAGVAALLSNYLPWILGAIIIILIAALAMRSRRPRIEAPARIAGVYCVSCGAVIPANVKYCPQCGAPQK